MTAFELEPKYMKPKIVVVGSSNTDMIIQMDRIPRPGETILGGQFTMAAGGKGANQAVAAARAGGEVTLVARLGKDLFGENAIGGFSRDGIGINHLVRDPKCPSGVALIFVSNAGENSIAVASGANARLTASDVRKARPAIESADLVLMQLEIPLPAIKAAVELARKKGKTVILNPAPAQPLPDTLLSQIQIVTPNETEAGQLTGMVVDSDASAAKAARILLAKGIQIAIITLGARGAWVAAAEGVAERVPGFKVQPVDTTAAGDVFNGALAVALGEGAPLLQAVRFANAAAAISTTRLGAQPSAPKRAEIDPLLKIPN